MYTLYRILTYALTPAAYVWLWAHPRHRIVRARLRSEAPLFDAPPIVLHACSVGEYNTALPLYYALKKRFEGVPILLTVSTPAAYALAKEKTPEIPVAYFPLDLPASVAGFFDSVQPSALIQVETEIWPNIFMEARRRDVLIIIVNGRISDKHYPRYLRFKSALKPVFESITAAGVQNDLYAGRFAELGCPAGRIRVTGNIKFDAASMGISDLASETFRVECGLGLEAGPVVVFGSTRPGDEALAAKCWKEIVAAFPDARMIVAPRHPQRADEAAAAWGEISHIRRSAILAGQLPCGEPVLLLDTLGELQMAYACADVAIVGGSFFPGVNGHNPLESAALGVPTLFGPYMTNFSDAAKVLLDSGAAVQVKRHDELPNELLKLLGDAELRAKMLVNVRKRLTMEVGAIERNVEMIAEVMGKRAEKNF